MACAQRRRVTHGLSFEPTVYGGAAILCPIVLPAPCQHPTMREPPAEHDRQIPRPCASCAQSGCGERRQCRAGCRQLSPPATALDMACMELHRMSSHPRAMPAGDDGRRATCPCQACTDSPKRSLEPLRRRPPAAVTYHPTLRAPSGSLHNVAQEANLEQVEPAAKAGGDRPETGAVQTKSPHRLH